MGNEKGEKSRKSCKGLSMVQNIRKRIGQTVIYGESRYTKRNGLEGVYDDRVG